MGQFLAGIFRRRRERGIDDAGGNRCAARRKPCDARGDLRPAGRRRVGLLGHVRPASAQQLRHPLAMGHVRAPRHRGGRLHAARDLHGRPHAARLPARCALARADRAVRGVRRRVHPDELPARHLKHQRGHGDGHPTDRPGNHHGHHLRSVPPRPQGARGGGVAVRARRRVRHRHAGRSDVAVHLAGGTVLGRHVRDRARMLHASARAGAQEVGVAVGHGPCDAVRRLRRRGGRPSVDL